MVKLFFFFPPQFRILEQGNFTDRMPFNQCCYSEISKKYIYIYICCYAELECTNILFRGHIVSYLCCHTSIVLAVLCYNFSKIIHVAMSYPCLCPCILDFESQVGPCQIQHDTKLGEFVERNLVES